MRKFTTPTPKNYRPWSTYMVPQDCLPSKKQKLEHGLSKLVQKKLPAAVPVFQNQEEVKEEKLPSRIYKVVLCRKALVKVTFLFPFKLIRPANELRHALKP